MAGHQARASGQDAGPGAARRQPGAPALAPEPPDPAQRGIRLAESIMAHALRAGLGPDGRLPTERRLAADLGVTRSSIRYALSIMQARGDISREVGRGTYLRVRDGDLAGAGHDGAPGGWPAAGGDIDGRSASAGAAAGRAAFAPADVMMVRRLLEPPAMPLAVAWATAADFDEMDRCLAGGDRAVSYEEFETWDLALHRSIMASTHSPLLRTLYASIEAARHGHIWGDLKRRSASADRRRLYQADHHEIVAALKARDSAGAVRAMRSHLARVSDHLNATDPAAAIWL